MSGGHDGGRALAELFAETARAFQAAPSPQATLGRIVRSAVETVPGCDHAGLMLLDRHGRVVSPAATGDAPQWLDQIQFEVGRGPCLDTIREHESHLIDDLASDPRWPEFCARAVAETGVRSMLSFRLFVGEGTLGALNLYSETPGAFDDRAHAVGAILAAHAAVAVTAVQQQDRAEHLDQALASSREIGMAMGILMARYRCTQDQAFLMLRTASHRLNIKLREVAARVVEIGELDEDTIRRLAT